MMKLFSTRAMSALILGLFIMHVSSNAKQRRRFRLSSSVAPLHYIVKLQPFLSINSTAVGQVDIKLRVNRPTSRIQLHASDLEIRSLQVKMFSAGTVTTFKVRGTKLEKRQDLFTIQLRKKLNIGSNYTLVIKFVSKISSQPRGMYKSSYWEQDETRRDILATQFWPNYARRAFPCFDEPGWKATFELYLARATNFKALSNMPLIDTAPLEQSPGWVWDQFATTTPMATYLLAFVVFEFQQNILRNASPLRITAWSRRELINETNLALEVAKSAVDVLEDYLNEKYSLPKLDLVALPLMAHNAMENWGLITFSENNFVFYPNESSAETMRQVSDVVAHEVAHQWFGNLVGFTWWTDLWLSEGFATYFAYLAVDKIHPEWKIFDLFAANCLQEVMQVDSLKNSKPIRTYVRSPEEVHAILGSIPYKKGAAIVRQMEHMLSKETLQLGLSKYIQHNKFRSVEQDDLWRSLTEAAMKRSSLLPGLSVKQVMDTWTLQAGYPVVSVERRSNSTATIKQVHFNFNLGDNVETSTLKWWIPITFTDQSNPYFQHTVPRTWLRPQDENLTVTGLSPPDKWIIFNLQQTGYYRVNYEPSNWKLLTAQLLADHHVFPDTNRAQLVDDSINLARAGILQYETALNLSTYLRVEESLVVWTSAFNGFHYLINMLRDSPIYGALRDYLLWLIEPCMERLGRAEIHSRTQNRHLLLTLLEGWACRLGHPSCVGRVQEFLSAAHNSSVDDYAAAIWKHDDSSMGGVVCSAVRQGGEGVWQAVAKLFLQSPHIKRRYVLGRALGCTQHVWLLNRLLRFAYKSGELVEAVRWLSESDVGRIIALQFVWNRKQDLSRNVNLLSSIINIVGQHLYSDNHQFMVRALSESLPLVHRRAVADVESVMQTNSAWWRRSYSPIEDWLTEHGFNASIGQGL